MTRLFSSGAARPTLAYLAAPILRSEDRSASHFHRRQRRFWCAVCFALGLLLGLML